MIGDVFGFGDPTSVFSTVEEYNRLDSYGDEALSAFAPEGELPPAEDSQVHSQVRTRPATWRHGPQEVRQ